MSVSVFGGWQYYVKLEGKILYANSVSVRRTIPTIVEETMRDNDKQLPQAGWAAPEGKYALEIIINGYLYSGTGEGEYANIAEWFASQGGQSFEIYPKKTDTDYHFTGTGYITTATLTCTMNAYVTYNLTLMTDSVTMAAGTGTDNVNSISVIAANDLKYQFTGEGGASDITGLRNMNITLSREVRFEPTSTDSYFTLGAGRSTISMEILEGMDYESSMTSSGLLIQIDREDPDPDITIAYIPILKLTSKSTDIGSPNDYVVCRYDLVGVDEIVDNESTLSFSIIPG